MFKQGSIRFSWFPAGLPSSLRNDSPCDAWQLQFALFGAVPGDVCQELRHNERKRVKDLEVEVTQMRSLALLGSLGMGGSNRGVRWN